MVPFEPEALPRLDGTSVFIGAGRTDQIAPASQAIVVASIPLAREDATVDAHNHRNPADRNKLKALGSVTRFVFEEISRHETS